MSVARQQTKRKKENKMKTYLNDITKHYFDVQDLNADKWAEDGNGFYTTDQAEIEWFKRLDKAYNNLTTKELRYGYFKDYDELIAFYEGRRSNDVE